MSGFLDENDTHSALMRFDAAGAGPLPDLLVPGLRLDGLAPQQMLVAVERHVEAHLGRQVRAVLRPDVDEDGEERAEIVVFSNGGRAGEDVVARAWPQIVFDEPGAAPPTQEREAGLRKPVDTATVGVADQAPGATAMSLIVTVADPDLGPGEMPAFDGTLAEARKRLTPGDYPATGQYDNVDEPVDGVLTVTPACATFTQD